MARRASSGLNPGIILAAVVVVAVVIYGGMKLLSRDGKAFEGVPRLEMQELLDNGNALRGNEYVVEGEIDEKLQFSERGQLVSVRVTESGGDKFIPIVIPAELKQRNIDTKQKYAFKVKFEKKGIAVATGMERQ